MKKMIRNGAIGIGIAMTIFGIVLGVFDLIGGGTFQLDNYRISKMFIGCILVGLGFGVPATVYYDERLPRLIQVIIHMGIGCAVYLTVGFCVGWIPTNFGYKICILIVAGQIMLAFLLWMIISSRYRREARIMNERLQAYVMNRNRMREDK